MAMILPTVVVASAPAYARDGSKTATGEGVSHSQGHSSNGAFHKTQKQIERYLDGIYAKEIAAYKDWQATGNPESYQAAWDAAHVFGDTADFAAVDGTVTDKHYDLNKNISCCDLSRDPTEVSGSFSGHSGALGSNDIGGIP